MRLNLDAFTALLKGLNMLSIVVLRTDNFGSLVDFDFSDILSTMPAKITSSNDTAELDLKKDPNVVIFRNAKAVDSLLNGDRSNFRLLAIGSDCANPENDSNRETLFSRLDQQFYVLCLNRDVLVEKYAINGILKTNRIATYSEKHSSGPKWDFVKEHFWERRANLEGLKLRGIADAHVPFTTIEERREFDPPDPYYEEIVELGGPYGEALGILERALNFTTDLKVRKDGKWGIIDSNGRWDGMINDLLNDDADFLPCSFYLTPSRLSAVDFLFPLGHDTMTLFVWTGEGNGDSFVLGTFIDPFRPALWALLVSISLVITTLAVVQRIYEKWRYLGRSPSLETLKFTGSVLWVTLTVYFGKRLDTFPKEVVWKGTLLGTLFVGNFVFISYRASLTSIFSVPTHSVPFKDLESLLESDFKLVVRGSEVVEERFRDAGMDEDNEGLDAQVWRRKLEPGDGMFAKGALEALEILKEENALGNMALYCELLHFQTILAASPMASEACKVKAVWMSPVRTPMSMAVKKGSPYSKLFASALLKELEVGYYYRELAKEMPLTDINNACDDDGDIFADLRLGINRIWLMFAVLAAGAVFAALMLGVEKLILPVGREDVFSEERRKAFRPVIAHLSALEDWVAASSSVNGAKDDAYDEERDRELEMVAAALASAIDKVSAARIVRKSCALDKELFSDISPKKKYKLFKRRNGSGGVGVILSESGSSNVSDMYKMAYHDVG